MTYRYFFCFWVLLVFSQTLFAQCPPPGFPAPGDICATAPVLCQSLDGYCKTINDNNVPRNFPGCPGWQLNNDEWFAFYAGSTTITFKVTPSNCDPNSGNSTQKGMQGGIYGDCGPAVPIALQCACTENPFILTSTSFQIGHKYWIVFDGCAGDVCDYSVAVLGGSMVWTDPGPISGSTAVCPATTSTFSIPPVDYAGSYTWTLTPPIGAITPANNNASVNWSDTISGSAQLCVAVSIGCNSNPTACTTVNLAPASTAVISGPGFLCPGSSTDLSINFTGEGPWRFVYTIDGVAQPFIQTTDNPYVLHVTQPGVYALKSMLSFSPNCPGFGKVSGSVTVQQSSQGGIDWSVSLDSLVCAGGSLNLQYIVKNQGGVASTDSVPVSFYLGNPADSSAQLLGTYTLTGPLAPDASSTAVLTNLAGAWFPGGASGIQTIYAVVNDNGAIPPPFTSDSLHLHNLPECDYTNNTATGVIAFNSPKLDLGPDIITCSDTAVIFQAGPGFVSYLWQDSTTLSTYTPTEPGTYWVEVTDVCGFRQRDSVFFSFSLLTDTRFSDQEICPGGSVSFPAPGFLAYAWAPATGLNCTNCPVVTASPAVTTAYTLFATDSMGCNLRDTFVVKVLPLSGKTITREFCPGTSVVINGVAYTQPGTVLDTIPSTGPGCDTVVTYLLKWLPLPGKTLTRAFCPGSSVLIGGVAYTQPGTVLDTMPSTGPGCDTVVTYLLKWLPLPGKTLTRAFCPGSSVLIGGVAYTQPGTVLDTIPSTGPGCDTVVTYLLKWLPLPGKTLTREFCPGSSVLIGGVAYTQPGTVLDTIPSTGSGCDTVVTYLLQYVLLPQPSTLHIQCPGSKTVVIPAGATSTQVTYDTPQASTDCLCGGAALHLLSGLSSGANFPVGQNKVCYQAMDSCGTTNSCCFTITVENEPGDDACDVKNTACIKFEILGIFQNAAKQKTYRMRVTNTCSNKLIYVAYQTPNGVPADKPVNAFTYTAPSGRQYEVRNPNYTPFYSIRFKSIGNGIATGQSDIFEYTLPPQADPTFVHAIVRLDPEVYFETHLNVFGCKVQQTQSKPGEVDLRELQPAGIDAQKNAHIFPNPATDLLFVDLSAWEQETLRLRVTDALGKALQDEVVVASSAPYELSLPKRWSAGVYQLEVFPAEGVPQTLRFVVQR